MDCLFLPEMLNLQDIFYPNTRIFLKLWCVFSYSAVFALAGVTAADIWASCTGCSQCTVVLLNSILFLDFNLYICVCYWFYVEAFKLENTVHKTSYTHKYILTHKKLLSHSQKINMSVSYVTEQVIKSYLNTSFLQFSRSKIKLVCKWW